MNNSFKFTNEPTGILYSWIKSYEDFSEEEGNYQEVAFNKMVSMAVNDSVENFKNYTEELLLNEIPQKAEGNKWQHRINTIVDELFFHSFYMVEWEQIKNALAEEAE